MPAGTTYIAGILDRCWSWNSNPPEHCARQVARGEDTMNRRLNFAQGLLIATLMYGAIAVGTAAAREGDSGEFRWLACSGMHDFGSLGDRGDNPTTCPDSAQASSNGDVIDLTGEGKLRIHEGKPKQVSGGGSFRHMDADGNLIALGTWTARKLLSFESFGPSTSLPANWSQGLATMRIHMISQSGDMEGIGTLTIGCLLPSPVTIPPPEVFEGIVLDVQGGPNFDLTLGPNATLFLRTN